MDILEETRGATLSGIATPTSGSEKELDNCWLEGRAAFHILLKSSTSERNLGETLVAPLLPLNSYEEFNCLVCSLHAL